ncbi:MAG: hypothetical protein QXR60_01925 [Candidatus Nanoarchaeia archaeon]
MLKKSNLVVLCLVLLLVTPVFAITGKIGNPRAVVQAEVTPTKPAYINRYLEVININPEVVNIMIDVSEDCKDMILIREENTNHVLQPDESKKVPYTIKVVQPGLYECKINTYFTTEDNKGAGVALASTIIINAKGKGPAIVPETDTTGEGEENVDVNPGNKTDGGEVTGGVSVTPGGKPNLDTKPDYSKWFAISFFVLMAFVVLLLALVALRRRRNPDEVEIKI